MAQTTITVDAATLERLKELKTELNDVQSAPDHTNDSFLHALMDTWECEDEADNPDMIAEQVVDLFTAEVVEPFNAIETQLDTDEIAEEVAAQVMKDVDSRLSAIEEQLPDSTGY